jgi:aminopeptidase N
VQNKPWTGIPNEIVYEKGAWALHMLRGEMGTEKFWAGIREYYRRFRDRNATTAEFRAVMEQTAGSDLGGFFQQWLYRAGSPVIEGAWKYDAAAGRLAIDLSQTQAGDAFAFPLEVLLIRAGSAPRIQTIRMITKQQHFVIPYEREPVSVELDPQVRTLVNVTHFAKR